MNENIKIFDKPTTTCKGCIFAIIGDNGCQNGCIGDLLYRFDEVDEKCVLYDPDTQHFLIERICTYCRSKKWTEELQLTQNRKIPLKELFEIVREQIKIRYEALVCVNKNSEILDMKKTADSLMSQDPKPTKIIFLINRNDISFGDLIMWANKNIKDCKWSFKLILEEDIDVGRVFDLGRKTVKEVYYMELNAGTTLKKDLVKTADKILNDDLEKVLCFESPDAIIYQRRLASTLGGNRIEKDIDKGHDRILLRKLNRIAEDQECLNMIKKI